MLSGQRYFAGGFIFLGNVCTCFIGNIEITTGYSLRRCCDWWFVCMVRILPLDSSLDLQNPDATCLDIFLKSNSLDFSPGDVLWFEWVEANKGDTSVWGAKGVALNFHQPWAVLGWSCDRWAPCLQCWLAKHPTEAQYNSRTFTYRQMTTIILQSQSFTLLLLLSLPQTTTITYALHARDIYMCPRECSPFGFIYFSISASKIGGTYLR